MDKEKVYCNICDAEITEWDYMTFWCGGKGYVQRPVCKDVSACIKKMKADIELAEEREKCRNQQ
jgi:hypothetical protein